MEGGGELGNEFAKVDLRVVGNRFEVDDDSDFVGLDGIRYDIANQAVTGAGAGQELRHFADAPDLAVVVVEQSHDRKFDVGGFHPTMELVVFQQRDSFCGAGFYRLIAFVVDDSESAVRTYGMQLLGD